MFFFHAPPARGVESLKRFKTSFSCFSIYQGDVAYNQEPFASYSYGIRNLCIVAQMCQLLNPNVHLQVVLQIFRVVHLEMPPSHDL